MIITGDSKGILKFWRFSTNAKFGKDLKLESHLCKIELHRPSSLLVVGLSDFSIQVNSIKSLRSQGSCSSQYVLYFKFLSSFILLY